MRYTRLGIVILILGMFALQPVQAEESVEELSKRIEAQKETIEQLEKNIATYQKNISQKQAESKTLKNQLSILENQIAKVELDIQATEARIEQTKLEIQKLNLDISSSEDQIETQQKRMGEYVRLLYASERVSYLEVLLTKPSFSDFFDQLKYTQQVYSSLNETLTKLQHSKQELETHKQNWEQKVAEEEKLKDTLRGEKSELAERSSAKATLLTQAQQTTKQYQTTLSRLQAEQTQINADIVALERKVREELEKRKKEDGLELLGPAVLSWPVSPLRGITTLFHDPDYPFRYVYEHPAIDIRAAQGTTIKAPASGYVAQIKFKGDKSYAYLMLIHSDGISTVYGHISKALVKVDQFVAKGDAIALSGGLPGTIGAGNLTTGAHLHFEVRRNGIPVDPLKYLPKF